MHRWRAIAESTERLARQEKHWFCIVGAAQTMSAGVEPGTQISVQLEQWQSNPGNVIRRNTTASILPNCSFSAIPEQLAHTHSLQLHNLDDHERFEISHEPDSYPNFPSHVQVHKCACHCSLVLPNVAYTHLHLPVLPQTKSQQLILGADLLSALHSHIATLSKQMQQSACALPAPQLVAPPCQHQGNGQTHTLCTKKVHKWQSGEKASMAQPLAVLCSFSLPFYEPRSHLDMLRAMLARKDRTHESAGNVPFNGAHLGPEQELLPLNLHHGHQTNEVAFDLELVECRTRDDQIKQEIVRSSIVNADGVCIFDELAYPRYNVVSYRTKWSGIRKKDLFGARSRARMNSQELAQRTLEILHACGTTVAHAAHNDIKALQCALERSYLGLHAVCDTSRFYKYVNSDYSSRSLKELSEHWLHAKIQTKRGHSSVEDARAAIYLYRIAQAEYERFGAQHVECPYKIDAIDRSVLRVARIVDIQRSPKWSKKMLVLDVDFGNHDRRKVIAPLMHRHDEVLQGKHIVCVSNVKWHKTVDVWSNAIALLSPRNSLFHVPRAQLGERIRTSARPVAENAPKKCRTGDWSVLAQRITFQHSAEYDTGCAMYTGSQPEHSGVHLVTEQTYAPIHLL